MYPSTAALLVQMPLARHGNLPRPKNVPPARFLNGLSIPVRAKKEGVERFYPSTAALLIQMPLARHGNLPRAKKVSTGHFFTLATPRSPSSIPVRAKKDTHRMVCVFPVGIGFAHPGRFHRSQIKRISHGLKTVHRTVFTPVCALVPPFRFPYGKKEKPSEWMAFLFW